MHGTGELGERRSLERCGGFWETCDAGDRLPDRPLRHLDVEVAWRAVGQAGPAEDERLPRSEERCPVPIGDIRKGSL